MGTATGYTIGVGRNLSSTLGVEFSFTDFSGMKYGAANKIYSEIEGYDEEENPIYTTEVTENFELTSGGEISSQFLAVGFNYRLGNLFGTLLGGMLKPYVGFQVGYAMNTLSDYTFDDENGYSDGDLYNWYDDDENSETYEETLISLDYCTGQNDLCTQVDYVAGAITYMGKTTRTLGYALEAGLTLSLDSNLELDFFYKRNILGTVSNTGNMLSTYYELATDWYDNPGTCAAGFGAIDTNNGEPICMIEYPEEVVDTRTERVIESGKVNINQFGVKLKYFF
jgi:hypothetical protein